METRLARVVRTGLKGRTMHDLVPRSGRFVRPGTVAAVLFVALLSTSSGYGWFRDELYFRSLGRRLGVAFADVPLFTPLVARGTATLFGDSLVALRVWPALCVVAVVMLNASLCKEFGGDRHSRTVAAAAVAGSPIALIFGHVFHYAAFDVLAWTVVVWCVVRIVAGASAMWWLAVGVTVGVGYENKNLILLVVIGLFLGLMLTGCSSVFRTRWFVFGVLIAMALAAPNIVWQLRHGLPEATLAGHIRSESSLVDRALVTPFQAALVGVPVVGLAVRGARRLWTQPERRFLPVAYLIVLALVIATGGKHYYAAGLLPPFLVAGAVEGMSASRRRGLHISLVLSATVSAFIGLPLLPQSVVAATPIPSVYPDVVESIGWPDFATQVDAVVDQLPSKDREHRVLLVKNYGEASALDRFGHRLAPVWSPHNQYWLWGPPAEPPKMADEVVIAVGFDRATLEQVFATVEDAGRIVMPDKVDSQEQDALLFVCRNRRASWATIWPDMKSYS